MSTLRHSHELRRYERFACPHLAQVLLTDVQLRGRVVRHTERGFAMQFELSDLWVH